MELFSLLAVLAITYKQGAARPTDDHGYITKNDLASSEDLANNTDGNFFQFKFPTGIRKGHIITINGTIKMNDKSFTVVLPSISGQKNCQIKYDFATEVIRITRAIEGYEAAEYNFSPESGKPPTFSVRLIARENQENKKLFGITFNGNDDGESQQLICEIESFEDIEYIMMTEGVAHVSSLQFEFGKNR